MKTAIVILNWNGRHLMQTFLPALIASIGDEEKIIIADNASSDNSVSWLKEHYPEIQLICNPVNEGFAKGYNTALKQIDAEYFILLNSDVEVTPGWIQPLIRYLDQHPATAVCQPKLLWQTQKNSFEYSGAAGGYIDWLGYPFCRGRIFGRLENDERQYDDSIPVFWASGACMAIRSKVFLEAGGFDPLFFAHMEEIDLCWRIHNMGYNINCIPSSLVYHVGGATLPKNNPGKTYLNFRNNLSMLYKNLPGALVFPVIFLRLVMDGMAGVKFLFEGHWKDCIAVIKAHFYFYVRILSRQLKRGKTRPLNELHCIYKKSIVIDFYLRKKYKFSQLKFHPVTDN